MVALAFANAGKISCYWANIWQSLMSVRVRPEENEYIIKLRYFLSEECSHKEPVRISEYIRTMTDSEEELRTNKQFLLVHDLLVFCMY